VLGLGLGALGLGLFRVGARASLHDSVKLWLSQS